MVDVDDHGIVSNKGLYFPVKSVDEWKQNILMT